MNEQECKHDPQYVVKHGKRKTKLGFTQRFMCLKCYRKFSLGIMKYNNQKETIKEFIRLQFKNGFASRAIAQQIHERFNIKISYATVLDWVQQPSVWMNNDQYKSIVNFNIAKLEVRIRKAQKRIDKETKMIQILKRKQNAMRNELSELDPPKKLRNKNHSSIK